MGYLRLQNTLPGAGQRSFTGAAAPVAGTDEVQSVDITGTPTGGTFRLKFRGALASAVNHDVDAAGLEAALEAAATIGSGNVSVSGTNPNFAVTFTGDLAKLVVPLLELHDNSLTGGTDPDVTITEDTPGVDATLRGQPAGTMYVDTANQVVYVNTGTALEPTWTVVGSQT